jgi:hypothetical protein
MIVVTVVAILLGLAVTFQGLTSLILASLIWCVLPTPLVICAIFGRGDVRAFAIGGLIPWFPLLRAAAPAPVLLLPVWLVVMSLICGTIGAATYRWVIRHT